MLDALRVRDEPYYVPIGDELRLFEAAYAARLPVMLKGPTGCGKTRFVEHMAWRLGRPLITVACNEEMSASDFLGRYLLDGGSLRRAVLPRRGGRSPARHPGRHSSADRRPSTALATGSQ